MELGHQTLNMVWLRYVWMYECNIIFENIELWTLPYIHVYKSAQKVPTSKYFKMQP